MQFFRDSNIDFMRYRRGMLVVSGVLIAAGIFAVFVRGQLNIGIDFAGGTQLTVKFAEAPEIDRLRDLVTSAGVDDPQIQEFGEAGANEVIIRTATAEGSEEGNRQKVIGALNAEYNQGGPSVFDLNQNGSAALAGRLLQLDPDARLAGGQAAAEAHYESVAQAIVAARQADGLLRSWEDVAAVPEVSPGVLEALRDNTAIGSFSVLASENVGPQIGDELRRKGVSAIIASLIGMLIYIWFRFELRFGVGALVALVHDVFVTLGLYAWAGFEFNLTTVAAFLTLVGYSVNDSVVVFDRVRENMRRKRTMPLVDVLNKSINQTLSRTVLTSGTTLLVVGSLLFLGGDVLRGFAFIIFVGVIVGTYSSIYVASPFTLFWEQTFGRERKKRRAVSSGGSKRAQA